MVSVLVLPPWIALRYSAWPRTKGICSAAHRSASQYQANRHSQPTTRPSRKGANTSRNRSCSGGSVASSATPPGLVEYAQRQRPGVQIDAAVKSVLPGVEVHHGLLGDGPAC